MINSIFYRSSLAFFQSFLLSLFLYKKVISWNKKKKFLTENIRSLGLIGEKKKIGIPTMGGVVIILSTLTSTILFSYWNNIYIISLIISSIWLGFIGFIDDYIKVKFNKKGLNAFGKILGQLILGIFIGIIIFFNENVKNLQEKNYFHNHKYSFTTSLPNIFSRFLFKRNEKKFDYSDLLICCNKKLSKYTWIIFITFIVIMIIFFSNAVNITDGIDGLAGGTSLIIFITLFLFSIISSNKYYSDYFNFIYIPNITETIIFSTSIIGSLISFIWYNAYPAQIFMGDTGSLFIGGLITILAFFIKIEFILPILGGIFLLENISVIIQILYLKYTKTKYGIGKRIFLMAPIHHHFQKLGEHENKICIRFIIIQIILSILSLILLIT
ncbi:phospho-N-acetylmuramoyl-pentapeptide-transferase [Blattabacterium cuenoti]|uniref:phospho-N-acetylmuramoyl-pentapeptide- transferase n=1 Tax=Blattabacterium cuenoti TaxID=1653831 RepID=UPI00163CFF95|nr:phospho-N-acetylmuramoyl-pentapeptide-transferase [Blattabacterium cuenoti]